MRTPATIHPETQPERYTDSTIVPSRTLSFNETTVYQSGSTLDSTAWTQHKELVIGVTICGVALILFSIGIITTIILYVRARKRKRIAGIETTDGTQVPGRSFFPFRKRPAGSIARDLMNGGRGSGETRGIHMTVLLTESHSANTDTDHSYAYINSELVSSTPRPLVRSNRPPALPPDRISVRQNPCYSATPAVSTEDLKSEEGVSDRVENIYDLPVFFPKSCQAREYEVPIRSPSSKSKTIGKPQHIYELTSDNV